MAAHGAPVWPQIPAFHIQKAQAAALAPHPTAAVPELSTAVAAAVEVLAVVPRKEPRCEIKEWRDMSGI